MLAKRWVLKNVLGRLAGVMVGQACGWARNVIKARSNEGAAKDEAESLGSIAASSTAGRQEVVRAGRLLLLLERARRATGIKWPTPAVWALA